MGNLLLVVIYAAFMSLGLPDSLLGVSWAEMRLDFNLDIDAAGIISSLTFVFTAISGFFSGHILRRYPTVRIVAVSAAMTSFGLLCTSMSPSFLMILACTIPLGLGAGAVDTALNNYVALNYKASHMNWLHCFWGVGATVGPAIMSTVLAINAGWRVGYVVIAFMQFALVILFICTRKWWNETVHVEEKVEKLGFFEVFKIKGAKSSVLTFFMYTSAEFTMGLWVSTYLIFAKQMSAAEAGFAVSAYFGGITIGRLLIGFFVDKIGTRNSINYGILLSLIASLSLFVLNSQIALYIASILIGIGFGPIYPGMIHETGKFGADFSPVLMGFCSSAASIGILSVPPTVGFLAKSFNVYIIPIAIVIFIVLCFVCSSTANKSHKNRGLNVDK